MGLLELLRGGKEEPRPTLDAYQAEARLYPNFTVAQLVNGPPLLAGSPDELAATLVAAWRRICHGDADDRSLSPLHNLVDALQERRPPLTSEQLAALLEDGARRDDGARSGPPLSDFVSAALSVPAAERPARLVRAIEGMRDVLQAGPAAERRFAQRIDIALTGQRRLPPLGLRGPFGRRVAADLEDPAMSEPAREAWKALLVHALAATAARPAARWLKQAKPLFEAIGPAAAARLGAWLELGPCPGEPAATLVAEGDVELIKGLLFAVPALGDAALAPVVANMAAASFRKIPNVGPVSALLGNAGINALAALPGPAAITQLGRLRLLVKYATARRLAEKALAAAATRAGVTPAEIEEMSVPTYGLDADGVARTPLGDDVVAEIAIADDEATLVWRGANGKVFKSVPASVKRDHAAALAELRRTVKEIGQVLPAQRLRLENLMIAGRELTVAQWRTRYLEHPLIGDMSRRLIWSIAAGGATTSVMSLDGRLIDARGAAVDPPGDARVHLHHPLRARPDETLAWRRVLESRELTQPFKQAHREVYLLTDAERTTRVYSNRFAGHILRQHQLAGLCRDRGWQYHLQGGFDGANNPFLRVPGTNIVVELWTEAPQDADNMSDAGIYLHVATDQVRFTEAGEAVPLEQIPPLIFSEIMRDVDLFVSVASIGTDPNWTDRGEQGAYGAYWQAFAFGELSTSATTRRAVLEAVVPKLKIRDRCSFDERHLVVRGELATYRIHLGSGNVLIEPGSRYLCIVPDASKGRGERVTLPFKGDTMMAVILSKAFLLAADQAIKDPTIVRQITTTGV